ncbi:riboflavin synthase [Helicovermis profundi]|uniref:Riboflavin synthase n=1 Tax=Helicovermis profundi TaxID=3065157 RepID=A0AAU9E514_9FIRM|nr:riboflavin synthase [Clostridia bacterium S502]
MFTGLVEEIGKVKEIASGSLTIEAKKVLEGVKIGDSICVNGICLSVNNITLNSFTVDVMPETFRRTNLKNIKKASFVNLERAMEIGSRFGGHIVSGHIDGTSEIVNFEKEKNASWITLKASKDILKYIILKGSVAIDGVSLTVGELEEDLFRVSIIPLTSKDTTLLTKRVGEFINIECDIVGKYVEKLMNFNSFSEKKSVINKSFLEENGFM